MSSTALYKAFIEVGASEKAATGAAEDVIQVSQLPQLATKTDLMALKTDLMAVRTDLVAVKTDLMAVKTDLVAVKTQLKSEIGRVEVKMAEMEARLIKWMVGSLFVFAGIIIAGVGLVN